MSAIRIEPEPRNVNVLFHDTVIASTTRAVQLHENGRDPVVYVPREDAEMAFLQDSDHHTTCPHKGEARYWSVSAQGYGEENAVWSYENPKPGSEGIAGYLAFYPDKFSIAYGNEP